MAVRNGVPQLEERIPDQGFLIDVEALFGDPSEKITPGAVLEDDICAVRSVSDLVERDHVWVLADLMMQLDLSLLESSLPGFEAHLVQRLYGKLEATVMDMDTSVNDPVRADTEDFNQLNSSLEDCTDPGIQV